MPFSSNSFIKRASEISWRGLGKCCLDQYCGALISLLLLIEAAASSEGLLFFSSPFSSVSVYTLKEAGNLDDRACCPEEIVLYLYIHCGLAIYWQDSSGLQ